MQITNRYDRLIEKYSSALQKLVQSFINNAAVATGLCVARIAENLDLTHQKIQELGNTDILWTNC